MRLLGLKSPLQAAKLRELGTEMLNDTGIHNTDLERSAKRRADMGDLIRRLREERSWTLLEASQRCGLSLSTISRIENKQLSLSFDNLVKLADGFGIDVSDLFHPNASDEKVKQWILTRNGSGDVIESPQYHYEYLCSNSRLQRMAPVISTVKCHSIEEFGDFLSHIGQEFIYVLEGAVDLIVETVGEFRLRAGDSYYFDSSVPHAVISVGPREARVLSVIWTPKLISKPAI